MEKHESCGNDQMLSCFFVHIFGAMLIYMNENSYQQRYNIVGIKNSSNRDSERLEPRREKKGWKM